MMLYECGRSASHGARERHRSESVRLYRDRDRGSGDDDDDDPEPPRCAGDDVPHPRLGAHAAARDISPRRHY